MRKSIIIPAVAVLALAVSACGRSEPVNAADANVTEMNTSDAIEGTTNDSMTNVDAAAGTSDNMMGANGMMNGASNTTSNSTGSNSTGGAMGNMTDNSMSSNTAGNTTAPR